MKEIELLQNIAQQGFRIFTTKDLQEIGQLIGLNPSSLKGLTHKMVRQGLLKKLFQGTFALDNTLLAGSPLHDYEVIPFLANPSAICCWNAMSYHGLTDQLPRCVWILSPSGQTSKKTSQYLYHVGATEYRVIRVQPHHYYGVEKYFINETPVWITDLERTLLDGLIRPQYSGGFFEVMTAFEWAQDRVNSEKLVDYALKYGILVSKRLGWVFETLGIFPKMVKVLKEIPCKAVYKLDVTRPNEGEILSGWNLRKNF